ncbi:MAG TPA: hypothetical protein VJB87_01280 [Candidatus Nanoarchaeia archaeon]|nr:hypothetical protein [Candidatus Nanoarchaeia archaeon]
MITNQQTPAETIEQRYRNRVTTNVFLFAGIGLSGVLWGILDEHKKHTPPEAITEQLTTRRNAQVTLNYIRQERAKLSATPVPITYTPTGLEQELEQLFPQKTTSTIDDRLQVFDRVITRYEQEITTINTTPAVADYDNRTRNTWHMYFFKSLAGIVLGAGIAIYNLRRAQKKYVEERAALTAGTT